MHIKYFFQILQNLGHRTFKTFSELLFSINIIFKHLLYSLYINIGYLCIPVFITLVDSIEKLQNILLIKCIAIYSTNLSMLFPINGVINNSIKVIGYLQYAQFYANHWS